MKINQVLVESAGATVAFAFGRFNPAHQGHIEVWRTVEQAGANWFIGTNPSTLGPNDPLTFQQKSAWMEEIYPPITGHIVAEQSVLTLAAYIFKKTRKNERATVAYITDAADWAWSGKLLNQYNGVEGAHGYYKFAEIAHVPSPRVSSATALRDAARADDRVAFYHASGTDPKSKVAGLTYFDTVKQAVEKYPLPVKRGQKVKEAPDTNFVGFMNKAMNTRQDNKPLAYDPKTVMSMDTMPGYKKAFKFGIDVIKKMDLDTKQEFANAPDDELFSYMMNIAEKKGYAPEQFMSEDLDEVTSEFEEIFHDPDMEGWTWTDLLRDMIGMEPRALSKANVQAHKKEFSHAQQMAAKGPGPIDPSKLKAVTRSDTKQTEIWYPINPNYEAGGWVVVATGFQNKEQAEQKLTQMQQDPRINTQIQAALDKKKNESVQQGLAEGQLNELAGYGSDKGYKKLDSYKRYDVYVSKQKFNNLYYIAVAENPRSLTAKFKAKGKNPQEAVQNLYAEVDKEIDVATKVSGRAIIDFNVDFVRDILELSTDTFYAKIISGPKLVLAGPEMMEYPEIMSSEGFKPSAIRTYKGGEGTTKLPAVPLSTSAAVTANLIANGRYVLGNEEIDKDGNRVFNLEFDSVVQDKNEKMRLRAPALTIGTARVSEETELVESTSLETTLKAIINDISEPVTSTYENLKYLAKKYVRDHGELDRGWNMVAMGPGSKWVEQFYKDKLKNELYDLIRYNSRYTVELQQFLRGVEINGELDVKRSFSNISRELPSILVKLGDKLQSPQLVKSAQRWMQNLKDYQMYLASLEDDEEDSYAPTTASTPRSTVPGQQNAQVEKIVNDILAKLPKNVSGEIRNIIARSSNKLQALQQELTNRNLSVKESSEQKTVTKTWDQMTPQEKISGVKGRTVWNEKTQRYYTVFDVPVKNIKEDDEAGEVKKTGQLIPFPAGTAKVHVSDVYDWYKLGMVISDLDDADPSTFGQGAPQSIIAFGSEEEESKLLPLLQRLGLRVDDIDLEGTDEIGEAYHAGELYEYLKKVHGKWALVSKSDPKKVLQYYRGGDEKPSDEWVNKVERRVHSFESKKK